jgi:hypothetical protein
VTGAVSQLALQVDPDCEVEVVERRGEACRTVVLGPLPEPQARELVALLLNREDAPDAFGPWRLAIAGGMRTVALRHRS